MQFHSEVGKGTTLCIFLPRSEKPLPQSRQVARPESGRPADCHRVLLVEDDDNVAGLVGEMLKELGYEALRAPSAAAALECLATGRSFDLVFSDMIMPGEMTGLDLAREVARRRPELPVLLTTGYSEAAASALDEGFALLAKPYEMQALATELQRALALADGASREPDVK